jgi:hypothetical protein
MFGCAEDVQKIIMASAKKFEMRYAQTYRLAGSELAAFASWNVKTWHPIANGSAVAGIGRCKAVCSRATAGGRAAAHAHAMHQQEQMAQRSICSRRVVLQEAQRATSTQIKLVQGR